MPQHDVTASLPVHDIALTFERLNQSSPETTGSPVNSSDLDDLFGNRKRHWVAVRL